MDESREEAGADQGNSDGHVGRSMGLLEGGWDGGRMRTWLVTWEKNPSFKEEYQPRTLHHQ